MSRHSRKKNKQYALDRFREEDPESFFKFESRSQHCLSQDQAQFVEAIETRNLLVAETLLDRGLDPNFTTSNQYDTPLHLVARHCGIKDPNLEKLTGLLLYCGADPDLLTLDGVSPLHLACSAGNPIVVQHLLSVGSEVDPMEHSTGATPFLELCSSRSCVGHKLLVLDKLLDAGANVKVVDTQGQTAIHRVLRTRHHAEDEVNTAKFIEVLLRHGVSVSDLDNSGDSPMNLELRCLNTARCAVLETLVRGGSSIPLNLFLQDKSRTRKTIHLLASLLDHIHYILPGSKVRELYATLEDLQLSGEGLIALREQVQNYVCHVPTLMQLCRPAVCSSLGGTVYVSVTRLPIPGRMKEFLLSKVS